MNWEEVLAVDNLGQPIVSIERSPKFWKFIEPRVAMIAALEYGIAVLEGHVAYPKETMYPMHCNICAEILPHFRCYGDKEP